MFNTILIIIVTSSSSPHANSLQLDLYILCSELLLFFRNNAVHIIDKVFEGYSAV